MAAGPPADLLKQVLERESEAAAERGHYTYRQSVLIEELDLSGRRRGEYRETRDIIFTPQGARHEKPVRRPVENLDRLRLTEEDFRDIREVQPFLFTRDQLPLYETRFKGEETIDSLACWVIQVNPRQILDGQRLFEGLVWVSQADFSVIRMEGRAVPQILGTRKENLFPRFTTTRRKVDGKFWFPETTYADDVLPFRVGPVRMRLRIEYSEYKRFQAESKVDYHGKPK
ncbi:MAG: hypothetical protein HY235_10045 [Acidobacteria bacterium]|nr:hypothetical protein [Acidobacteriota bacterium]